jgi:hypothetical protein
LASPFAQRISITAISSRPITLSMLTDGVCLRPFAHRLE